MKSLTGLFTAITLALIGAGLGGCGQQTAQSFVSFGQSGPAHFGQEVIPNYPIVFPQDHGAHPEFGLEWWYITANLTDEFGQDHGLQWTLFRFKTPEANNQWGDGQSYMAHLMHEAAPFAQGAGSHRAWQRYGRSEQVLIQAEPFVAGIDHWWLRSQTQSFLPLQLVASEQDFAAALTLNDSPLILHGDQGYSDKSGDGQLASYYYSLPRLKVAGHIKMADGWRQVTGDAWLDREWSSALLDERFSGWDWFGLQLDNGQSLMLFCLLANRGFENHCDGSLISVQGDVITLANQFIDWEVTERVKLDGSYYPIKWDLNVPEQDLQLKIQTRLADQRNKLDVEYWEGPVQVSGSHSGVGFVEMTGRKSQD